MAWCLMVPSICVDFSFRSCGHSPGVNVIVGARKAIHGCREKAVYVFSNHRQISWVQWSSDRYVAYLRFQHQWIHLLYSLYETSRAEQLFTSVWTGYSTFHKWDLYFCEIIPNLNQCWTWSMTVYGITGHDNLTRWPEDDMAAILN